MMTSAHRRRHGAHIAGLTAAIVLLLAGCGNDESDVADPTATPEPTLTAPPTTSPEDEAKADIEQTFAVIIEKLDDFYANASDYADRDLGWGATFVQDELNMRGQAALDFENSTAAYIAARVESVGSTEVATIEVTDIALRTDIAAGTAVATACLDDSGIEFRTYEGEPAPDFPASQSQQWKMTWDIRHDIDESEGAGVYLTGVQISPDHPC